MRLIPSDECARVYSFLGGRPFQRGGSMAGCGAGAGFSSERLDPRMVPGCQLMACTDTTAFPGAVQWPVDPVVNGGFEGAAGPASWTVTLGTISREAGTRTGGAGSYVGQIAHDGVNITGGMYQDVFVVGNTYRVTGWGRSVDGTAQPIFRDGSLRWTGTNSTAWQPFDTGPFVATTTYVMCYSNTLAAGRAVQFDDITITPLNASRLTDLTGLGHHLVQATAASQLLWTASGAGGYLSSDGVADRMNVAYASNQPRTRYALARVTVQASARTLFDGATADTGALKHKAGSTTTQCNAGSAFDGPALTDATWMFYAQVLNGAASAVSINGGAFTVGDAGAGNPGGVYLGCGGAAAAGTFAVARYAMFLDYDGAHDINQVRRMYRYSQRLAARLAI
jgi:hypothetical protein